MTARSGNGPVIGVLGGMGPAATVEFFRRLVAATPAQRDQDHLHIIIDDDPSVPDRTRALLGQGPDPSPTLIAMARRLQAAGADILVVPCNTAAAFAEAVAAGVTTPLLRWDIAAIARLRALRPASRRIGVLATSGTISTGIYARGLAGAGLGYLAPDGAAQHQIDAAIAARKAGATRESLIATVTRAAEALTAAGADEVLLGCTELSDIASAADAGYLDTMDLVISRLMQLVVKWRSLPRSSPWPGPAADIAGSVAHDGRAPVAANTTRQGQTDPDGHRWRANR